ncbi:MAG: hypothetical protein LBN05_08585 [Oscillospiraceae bacterium]|nr:hypothetical protein [Oscillospiraceae bacterium]
MYHARPQPSRTALRLPRCGAVLRILDGLRMAWWCMSALERGARK